MAKYRGTTTERGLGAQHRAQLRALKAAYRDGDPCCICGCPMRVWHKLDGEHDIPRIFGGTQLKGLAHRYCNRSQGAALGNRLRAMKRQARR